MMIYVSVATWYSPYCDSPDVRNVYVGESKTKAKRKLRKLFESKELQYRVNRSSESAYIEIWKNDEHKETYTYDWKNRNTKRTKNTFTEVQ